MGETFIFLGLLIFMAHLFSVIFSKKRIPDVLLLMVIGILIGPVLGLISPADLGIVGSVFASLTLVFILFESGTDISISSLRNAWKNLAKVCLMSFVLSVALVGIIGHFVIGLEWNASLMLGAILGGTSSAVVIPLVKQLSIHKDSEVVLVLESAITDVLCIVFALAFMESYKIGGVNIGSIVGKVSASFIMALMLGIAGGIVWSSVLDRVRKIQNSMFLTPAFVFIIYGITEAMGFSGAIASLAFGIVIGNTEYFKFSFLEKFNKGNMMKLEPQEKAFFSEFVFLLKTLFFVYIGLSIPFDNLTALLYGALITLVLFVMRFLVIKFSTGKKTAAYDRTIMSMMIPKGLAAAVLATMPEQLNISMGHEVVPGAEMIKYTTYSVVFISILFTSFLILFLDKIPFVKRFCNFFFGGKADSQTVAHDTTQNIEKEYNTNTIETNHSANTETTGETPTTYNEDTIQ